MPKMCKKDHRYDPIFKSLPDDQGGAGRHACAGCAYERGLKAGQNREENIKLDLGSLPTSQAGEVRHKSPHAAWALGYQHGVAKSYGLVT
jgi:hypothetical protein